MGIGVISRHEIEQAIPPLCPGYLGLNRKQKTLVDVADVDKIIDRLQEKIDSRDKEITLLKEQISALEAENSRLRELL